jgi:hypothetical protein
LSRFSGPNHPFKPGGGQFLNQNQPPDTLCLTCTGDSQPGNDPNTRQLPTVGNRPILIPVFVAGASNQTYAISVLGNNVTTTLMINDQSKNPVRIDAEVHGINFPPNNPFNEPAVNNPNYHTVGFWFKIPPNEAASVNTIEFGGTSSTFSTSVKYSR